MANSFKIIPSKLPISWTTGSNYRISLTADFARTTGPEVFSNVLITTATTFSTFTTTYSISTSTPTYNQTASITATISITYNRGISALGTNTNYYLYEKSTPTDILVATMPTTSSFITNSNVLVTFLINNYLEPLKTYYITNDAGVVRDMFDTPSPQITNDSQFKWNTGPGTVSTLTTFTNFAETGNNGLVKFANIYFNNTVTSNTGTLAIYRNDSLFLTWPIKDTNGITVSNNRVKVKTNSLDSDVAPEGNYYILFDTGVLSGPTDPAVGIVSKEKVAWTNTIVKNITNYAFTTGTNYIFTSSPQVIFTEGVSAANQNRKLTLELTVKDGQFGHASTGTLSGNTWTFIGTQTEINNLWSNIYFTPTIYTNNTFSYRLSSTGTGLLANEIRNLIWIPPASQFGASMNIAATNDAYKGTGSPFVKNETVTLTAQISTTTNILEEAFFRVNGITIGSAPFSYNAGINTASTQTTFDTVGTYTIQTLWNGGTYNSITYAGLSSATVVTIENGYNLDTPFTVSVSPIRVTNEETTLTASFTTSSTITNTVTFISNNITLGSVEVNTLTNSAIYTATFVTSGTYNVNAIWSGGYIDDNRFYNSATSTTATFFVDVARNLDSVSLITVPDDIVGDIFSQWGVRPVVTATAILNTSSVLNGTITFITERVGTVTSGTVLIENFTPTKFNATITQYVADATVKCNIVQGLSLGQLITVRSKDNAYIYDFTITNIVTSTNTLSIRQPTRPEPPGANIKAYYDPFIYALGYTINDCLNGAGLYLSGQSNTATTLAAVHEIELLNFWVSPAPKVPLSIPTSAMSSPLTYTTATITNNSASVQIGFVNDYYTSGTALTTAMNIVARFDGQAIQPKFYPKLSNTSTVYVIPRSTSTVQYTTQTVYRRNLDGSLITNFNITATVTGSQTFSPSGIARLYYFDQGTAWGTSTFTSTNVSINVGQSYPADYFGDGSRSFSIRYEGDYYNSPTKNTNVIINFVEYRPTNLSFSRTTSTIARPNNFNFIVATTGTIFNGSLINFYDNNILVGTSTVTNTTATFTFVSSGTTLGAHTLRAEMNPNSIGYNFVNTSTNFTIT